MDLDARDSRDEGYLSPFWHCVKISHDALQRLERDDDDVNEYFDGFDFIGARDWIEGAGRIIGSTKRLKAIELWFADRGTGTDGQYTWIHELCEGLSRNRTIEKLYIDEANLDCILGLTPFFVHNDNLRCLEVSQASPHEMDALLKILSKCKSGLEFIKIESKMSDSQQVIFFNSLSEMHSSLLELWIGNRRFGKKGIVALANLLMNPACKIRLLQVDSGISYYDNDSVLSDAMIGNSSMNSLHLTGSPRAPYLSSILSHQMCSIENIWLVDCGFDDDDIICLGGALADNRSLKHLYLESDSVTAEGWRGFSVCFATPLALNILDIEYTEIDEDGAMAIVAALISVNILSMERLLIGNESNSKVRESLSRVLCDNSSIDNTFLSCHTLHTIQYGYQHEPPDDCENYLQLNMNKNKVEVARQKIMEQHFSGSNLESNVHVFARMPVSVLPTAIEWIGRDNLGYSLMFCCVQSIPALLEQLPEPGVKRRRR